MSICPVVLSYFLGEDVKTWCSIRGTYFSFLITSWGKKSPRGEAASAFIQSTPIIFNLLKNKG